VGIERALILREKAMYLLRYFYFFALMTHRSFLSSSTGSACATLRARSLTGAVALALGSALLVASSHCVAQIQQGSGSSGSSAQENRTSSTGSTPGSSATAVHESLKPQSKDAAGNARGATTGKGQKTDGAGGFNNGLYGTGAGSNK
jgi:hypothetical protein